jgi:ATP-dependent RNA helicase RhlE
VAQGPQTTILQRGVDILVATPGRLLDLMNQGYITLKDIEIFVLDEADRMLDMGFIHDVKKLIAALPVKRQSLFFSATMAPEIIKLASTILHNPSKVMVTPSATTVDTVQQFIFFVDKGNKNSLLVDILQDTNIRTALVFTRTKHGADKVVKVLLRNNIKAEAIHGNKGQNARQKALANFKDKSTRVLVATDIAARGIDVDDMEFVINFEIPNIPETYVHRIGRTGRAGANGTAYSFCDAEEKAFLRDIEKLISIRIPVRDDHSYPLIDHNPVKAPKQEFRRPESRRPESRRPESRPASSIGLVKKARY